MRNLAKYLHVVDWRQGFDMYCLSFGNEMHVIMVNMHFGKWTKENNKSVLDNVQIRKLL